MTKYKIGDLVRLPSERPADWNHYGKMDHFLGRVVRITEIREYLNEDIFTFEGDEGWIFRIDEIVEKVEEPAPKTRLVQFDVLQWTPDKKVVTRSGSPVVIFDTNLVNMKQVLGKVQYKDADIVKTWFSDGAYVLGGESDFDLFFVEEVKTQKLYINWYPKTGILNYYVSESIADRNIELTPGGYKRYELEVEL